VIGEKSKALPGSEGHCIPLDRLKRNPAF